MRRSGNRTLIAILTSIMLGVGTMSAPVFAAEKKTSAKKNKLKKKKKTEKKKDAAKATAGAETPMEGESAGTGKSKKELLGNLGLSPSPLVGFGFTAGSLNSTGSGPELGFTYSSGKSGTIGAKVTHLGARYRIGALKIGYLAGGVGFRMASGNWFVLNQTQDNEYKAGASLNAVTFDGAVGAQMRLGSILIGADLVGFSYPIFKMGVKKTIPTEEDYDTADADSQQAKFDKLGAGLNLTLFKAGVGLMF